MITPKLTENIVFNLLNSPNKFSVNFDLAYRWLEFTRKDNAKRSLIECGFIEGIDFCYSLSDEGIETSDLKTSKSINKKAGETRKIWLTVDCFKTWGMMAATQKGKEVRQYFLECERKVKELAANPVKQDWVLADLFENDVLASALDGLRLVFEGIADADKQTRTTKGMNKADIAHALLVVSRSIQDNSLDGDKDGWVEEGRFDNLRWCIMVREAFTIFDPLMAAKWLAARADKNPNEIFLCSFRDELVIPGYRREGTEQVLFGNN